MPKWKVIINLSPSLRLPPHSAHRVKCHSLLVVTVANHLTFHSNRFQDNRWIPLLGTWSYARDCSLFI